VAKNLVVVESPAKAKTIEKYMGKDYQVLASMGHVRDLPKSSFAVEVNGGVKLSYEPISRASAKKAVAAIRAAAKKADTVWLAPDPDREGEAIAWHVAELVRLKPERTRRVAFNEITKKAVTSAFASPRALDMDLVDAQQARRAVDRIVGYKLSPLLWRTVGPNLSAGRVQSAALHLVVEREREVDAVDDRRGRIGVEPADVLEGGEDRELVAGAALVEDPQVVDLDVRAHALHGVVGRAIRIV